MIKSLQQKRCYGCKQKKLGLFVHEREYEHPQAGTIVPKAGGAVSMLCPLCYRNIKIMLQIPLTRYERAMFKKDALVFKLKSWVKRNMQNKDF